MSRIMFPDGYSFSIIDLPGPDPDSPKQFDLIARLLHIAISEYGLRPTSQGDTV